MPPAKLSLSAALGARDVPAIEHALRLRVSSPTALWRALEGGLEAPELAALGRAAKASAEPVHSLARLLDLLPALPAVSTWTPPGRRALAAVLGGSPACARYMAAQPRIAVSICCGPWTRRRKPLAVMRHELRWRRAAAVDEAQLDASLRRYRVREWVRIVARQLAGLAGAALVIGEHSDLAEAVIQCFTRYHLRRERSLYGKLPDGAGFAVLAQGKLGAQELNVSSDVDVQFLFDGGHAARPLHERYTRVAQNIVQSLSRRDDQGFCYRVDIDLRPEGKKGTLVNSVAGAEHYYEVWGQSWERLALIRARHVAGAAWVTRSFLEAVRPFVFPRSVDMAYVEEIRSLKERVHEERRGHSLRMGRAVGVDIKRDTGCIREIELFVQILQLFHGGRVAPLRTPSLIHAMERLQFAGHITLAHQDALKTAYLFLRDVENAIQAVDERQTHRLPEGPEDLAHLARLMHLNHSDKLLRRISLTRRRVARITRPLFGESPKIRRPHRAVVALSATDSAEQAQALRALGFADSHEAVGALQVLQRSVGSPFSRHAPETLRRLAAPILADIARSPDPDQALRLYGDLDRQLKRHPGYLRMLGEAPALRRRLIDLLGTSEFLGRTIIHFPELIDWLAAARDLTALLARRTDTMHAEVYRRLEKLPDVELKLRSLRRFKLQEQLRIAMLDLAGSLGVEAVQDQLSLVAEVCLRSTLDLAAAEVWPQFTQGFAVLALGRLGGREMGYGSDLDLLFIYDDTQAPTDGARAPVRLAQRLIQYLTVRFAEGALYAIDTRLRPSGAQGPLVTSATGFMHYHRSRAMLWERQALLRARPVAGDLALGESVLTALTDVRYPAALPQEAAVEIQRVRSRMEVELARESASRLNIKTGRGALVDLDFMVQYLQLKHGHTHPTLRLPSTPATLVALQAVGLLSAQKLRLLTQAYRFLRLLELRLRIVHDRPIAEIDFAGPAAVKLARRMGYATADRLRRDYERTTRRVRRLYGKVFAMPEGKKSPV